MPMKRTVWDKHTGTTLEMWDIDAREACANDRRYSLSKPVGFGAKPPAKGEKFAKFDHDKDGGPGGSLPKGTRGPVADDPVPTE